MQYPLSFALQNQKYKQILMHIEKWPQINKDHMYKMQQVILCTSQKLLTFFLTETHFHVHLPPHIHSKDKN